MVRIMFKRIAAMLCTAVLLFGLFASVATAAEATGVTVSTTSVTISVGQKTTVRSTLTPANSTTASRTWRSSDASIATVNQNGQITGKKVGTATVTVTTAANRRATVAVRVIARPSPTKITTKKSATIGVGERHKPSLKFTPDFANKTVTYKSSNTKVARVDSKGNITGIATGTAKITVRSTPAKKNMATIDITVRAAPTRVSLPGTRSLSVGQAATQKVTTSPSKARVAGTWTSSNTKIATVNSSGRITPKKTGTTRITFRSYNGLVTNTMVLTVTPRPPPTKIAVGRKTVTLGVTQTHKPVLTFTPSFANKSVSYKSSDERIATVNSKGTIRAVARGKVTITVTSKKNNKILERITVNVLPAPASIRFNSNTTAAAPLQIGMGQTPTPAVTIAPSGALGTRTYTSSDTSVLTVDRNTGRITPRKAGSARITVATWNGHSHTLFVRVNPAPTAVRFNQASIQVLVGQTLSTGLTFTPSNAHSSRTHTSANTGVATVNASGAIRGVAVGTTTVAVECYNGRRATINVVVTTQAIINTINRLNNATRDVVNEKPGYNISETAISKATISPKPGLSLSDRLMAEMAITFAKMDPEYQKWTAGITETSTNRVSRGQAGIIKATTLVPANVTAVSETRSGTNTKYTMTIRNETNLTASSAINRFSPVSYTTAEMKQEAEKVLAGMTLSSFSARTQGVRIEFTLNSAGKIVELRYRYDIITTARPRIESFDMLDFTMSLNVNQGFTSFVR